jgi:hypothetical protein
MATVLTIMLVPIRVSQIAVRESVSPTTDEIHETGFS